MCQCTRLSSAEHNRRLHCGSNHSRGRKSHATMPSALYHWPVLGVTALNIVSHAHTPPQAAQDSMLLTMNVIGGKFDLADQRAEEEWGRLTAAAKEWSGSNVTDRIDVSWVRNHKHCVALCD